MKAKIHFFILCAVFMLLICGCDNAENDEKDLQRLSLLEVYSSSGELIKTIEDEDTLIQFNDIEYVDITADTEDELEKLEADIAELSPIYTVVSYKTPAAVYNDGDLEKQTEITVHENSNIIKEQIAPENVKAFSAPEELLTFYFTVSDEDRDFLLSLAVDE